MDSREYFLSVRDMSHKLKILEDEIRELEESSRRVGALDYSKERIQSGSSEKLPPFVRALDKIDEKKAFYQKRCAEYLDFRSQALINLDKLGEAINQRILYLKFFKAMSLEEIAKLKDISKKHVEDVTFKNALKVLNINEYQVSSITSTHLAFNVILEITGLSKLYSSLSMYQPAKVYLGLEGSAGLETFEFSSTMIDSIKEPPSTSKFTK